MNATAASAAGRSIDGPAAAAAGGSRSAAAPPNVVGSSGGFALPAVTLDMLVRAVHGGAAAAARLATPEGCAAAAQLVAGAGARLRARLTNELERRTVSNS